MYESNTATIIFFLLISKLKNIGNFLNFSFFIVCKNEAIFRQLYPIRAIIFHPVKGNFYRTLRLSDSLSHVK